MLIDDLIINEEMPVLQAMQILNDKEKKILFIAPELKLKAVLTDGDIRRHILRGGRLDAKVGEIANYNFLSLKAGQYNQANSFMIKHSIYALPLLDSEGVITDVVFFDESSVKVKKNLDLPVVIMAGGLGTRLYPYTKILPKPLIPVGEKPIIEHIIDHFRNFGCDDYKIIVNHKKNMIKAYFNELNKDYNVDFADEEVFLGTGGGLALLKDKVKGPFFLTNCDVLIEADYNDIYKFHQKNGNLITVVCALKHVTIPYGVFNLNCEGEIESVTEKPKDNKKTSSFQALMVSTASRVGTGNIIGVSTAICSGGFGAVFWMWIIALIGGASAFVESTLAQIFKKKGSDGYYGGPSYYIESAFKSRALGIIFSVFLILTYAVGFNLLASYNLQSTFSGYNFYNPSVSPWAIGLILALVVGYCLFGGGKRIVKVSSFCFLLIGS